MTDQQNNPRTDFAYEISDERLITYSRIPLIDRLRWLDEVRQFTLLVRNAPSIPRGEAVEKNNPNPAR